MQEPSALGRIVELVRDLRRRCPWDAAQTSQSLRPYFVEEAMELDHAMAHPEEPGLRTELGDVMLHVAFQIALAEERGAFGAEDLTRAVEEKMWRRHPHLFPPTPRTQTGEGGHGWAQAGEVAPLPAHARPSPPTSAHDNWERRKLEEREGASVLDGLPPSMPALVMAYRLQEKAAGVGFDWPDVNGPMDKVREETEEVEEELRRQERQSGRVAEEIGDLLFAVVNLARKAGCDPRAALEGANARFTERFRAIERLAAERGIDVGSAGLEVLDGLWNEVKAGEGGRGRA